MSFCAWHFSVLDAGAYGPGRNEFLWPRACRRPADISRVTGPRSSGTSVRTARCQGPAHGAACVREGWADGPARPAGPLGISGGTIVPNAAGRRPISLTGGGDAT